ncbi:UDP-glucose dehydrogenase family protein [Geodermatophilus sp. SYSU D00684]
MRLTVIGTGYLGAVHAACMADLGHSVLGVDVDPVRVRLLAGGRTPFFEPGFADVLHRGLSSGRLRFTTSMQEAAEFADVHFLCVGTPQAAESDAADLRHVYSAVEQLACRLQRPCLVVGKSTVPVGTAARLEVFANTFTPRGDEVRFACNPEFLREGFAVRDTLTPTRIVVGAEDARAVSDLRSVYAPLLERATPFIVTDRATAELVKVAANAFLATKISFINAMAEVCEAAEADVVTLARAIGHDPRIGPAFLSAGLGFGGGCLGKDIRAFAARADELGVGRALGFLREVDEINLRRRQRTVDLAREMLGDSLSDQPIAVLGAAFKPDSDDIRDSPALAVAAALHAQGAQVRVHDPEAVENARAAVPALDFTTDVTRVLEGARLVLHVTEWQQYQALDPARLRPLVAVPRVLDARNALDLGRWRAAGWTVRALGRRREPAEPPLAGLAL